MVLDVHFEVYLYIYIYIYILIYELENSVPRQETVVVDMRVSNVYTLHSFYN